MTSRFRWGILGTGRIAQDFVTALHRTSTRGEVVAVASRHLESSKEFSQKYGIPKSYGSYEELLNDPEVDAIYIAALQHVHAELAVKALKKKKPVLCEKPLAINQCTPFHHTPPFPSLFLFCYISDSFFFFSTVEVDLVLRTAQEEKVFLMEAHWMSFFPLIKRTNTLISSGVLGEIKFARADFGWKNDFTQKSALTTPEFGGGSLSAVGCYVLALGFMAFQSLTPSKVSAQGEVHQGWYIEPTLS
jgi:dihydrodiol dehydrogenase / D-xylose 1-dehydrogenase (NADP)